MGRPPGSLNKRTWTLSEARKREISRSSAGFWTNLTPEERSIEMKRRRAVAKHKLAARLGNIPTTENPFAGLEKTPKSVTGTTLREYISNVEEALASLKSFLGY